MAAMPMAYPQPCPPNGNNAAANAAAEALQTRIANLEAECRKLETAAKATQGK
jgi:hypothetical protein